MVKPSLAEFIRMGMTKDKWPGITIELIEAFVDDPTLMDNEEEFPEFIESFFRYYDWWWRDHV